jgi:hypothetical protein
MNAEALISQKVHGGHLVLSMHIKDHGLPSASYHPE